MTSPPLISIIIPTYNRASIIGETLKSILSQTYTQWECLVVDDGSEDNTQVVMENICLSDKRFSYYQRPSFHKKGGNGARNYGLKLAKGDFIQFFDSDDLMVPQALEKKIEAIQSYDVDLVISRTEYFGTDKKIGYDYPFSNENVNFINYATSNVNWFTPDAIYKNTVVEGIFFNEELLAGQEYNFNCRVLANSNVRAHKIDEVLTLRRDHDDSIGAFRQRNPNYYLESKFYSHWHTYLDCKSHVGSAKFDKYSLQKCVFAYLEHSDGFTFPKSFPSELKRVFGMKFIYFYLASWSKMVFGRYFYFYNKLRNA